MSDIKIARHPLKEEVFVIFNEKIQDVFTDVDSVEIYRVRKQVVIQKYEKMSYVDFDYEEGEELQDLGDDSLKEIPWTVLITKTNLYRRLQSNDQFIVGSDLYTVSKVKPINRFTDCVMECLVYQERSSREPLDRVTIQFDVQGLSEVQTEVMLKEGVSNFRQVKLYEGKLSVINTSSSIELYLGTTVQPSEDYVLDITKKVIVNGVEEDGLIVEEDGLVKLKIGAREGFIDLKLSAKAV